MSLFDMFKKKSSGDVAKDRLKLLLVSDRANCSPDIMEAIKNDIIAVISKYMEIDALNNPGSSFLKCICFYNYTLFFIRCQPKKSSP